MFVPPEVSGNLVVIASCSGSILAFDREDGSLRWTVDARLEGEPRAFHGEMTRTEDGLLLVGSDPIGGSIYAIRMESGEVMWQWPSGAGTSSDLLVAGSSVIAVDLDHRVVALSLAEGRELWSAAPVEELAPDRFPATSSPLLWEDRVLLARADGSFTGVRARDGRLETLAELDAGPSTDLTRVGDRCFLGLQDGHVVLLDPHTGELAAESWLEDVATYRWWPIDLDLGHAIVIGHTGFDGPERRLVALDASTLEVRWERRPREPDSAWSTAQPAIVGPWILVGHTNAVIEAIDPRTGETQWELPLDHVPRVILADGADLWVGSTDGHLVARRRGTSSTPR